MFNNMKADIKRFAAIEEGTSSIKMIVNLTFTQGLWAVIVYRFGFSCSRCTVPLVASLLKLFYFFLNKVIEIITGISISSNARIGKGLYIGHFGGIFINEGAIIGENATIAQGVTIGTGGLGKIGAPAIGDNVFIGSGAKVLGNITVGDNVRIGANAVVVKDIPDNATVTGVPAKIVKINA